MESLRATLSDELMQFEICLQSHPYVLDRHAIIVHALSAAQFETPNLSYCVATPPTDATSQPRSPYVLQITRAVEALGLVCQAVEVSGLLSAAALTGIRNIVQATSTYIARSSGARTDGTTQISDRTRKRCGELCSDDSYATMLEFAIYAVLHTRFELIDSANDQKVYLKMLELLQAVLLHPHISRLEAVLQVSAVCYVIRMAVDADHTSIVRQAATTIAANVLKHYVSLLECLADTCPRCLDRVQMVLLFSAQQLTTIMGAPPPKSVALRTDSPTSADATNGGLHASKVAQTGTSFVSPRMQLLAFCDPILPFYAGSQFTSPLPLTVDVSKHAPHGLNAEYTADGQAYTISWPASRITHGNLEDMLLLCGRADDAPVFSALSCKQHHSDTLGATPAALDGRLARVSSTAAIFAMSTLSVLLSSIRDMHLEGAMDAPVWRHVIADRLCVALSWAADGIGPESNVLRMGCDVCQLKQTSGSAWFGGNSAKTTAPTTSTSTSNTTTRASAVTMKVPQLPVYSAASVLLQTLISSRHWRAHFSSCLEVLLHRILVRALAAPSRLIVGVAALVGAENMRILLKHLAATYAVYDADAHSIVTPAVDVSQRKFQHNNLVKEIVNELQRAFPGSEVDVETVKTLVGLFAPRSVLVVLTECALRVLHCLCEQPDVVAFAASFDSRMHASDMLRSIVQTCAGLAFGEAHVHALHGSRAAAAVSSLHLPAPLPETLRVRARSCLRSLFSSFAQLQPVLSATEHMEALRVMRERLQQKRVMQASAKAFNSSPKRGTDALRAACQESGTGGSLFHRVAEALRERTFAYGFHPVAVGEYLGTGATPEDDVKRRTHANLHADQYTGASIVDALRKYLSSFRLPGEAQMIDRILQSFATVAHASCKEATFLPSIDATYILSFSIIMLNTDLHNPSIRPEKKMSEDAFVKNNAYYGDEVCHGRRIPEHILRELYQEIKTNPISPPMTNIFGLPLQLPSLGKEESEEDAALARDLVAGGDALTLEAWTYYTIAGGDTDTDDAKLYAALVCAFPEVWHVCTRLEMQCFTGTFFQRETPSSRRSDSDTRATRAASLEEATLLSQSPSSETVDIDDMLTTVSGTYLSNLSACAAVANWFQLHSGVDIIVSALCWIAMQSLSPSEHHAARVVEEKGLSWVIDAGHKMNTPNDIHAEFRSHMALSGALSLVTAGSHAAVISQHTWEHLFHCISKLLDAGLISLPFTPLQQILRSSSRLMDAYALAASRMMNSRRAARSAAASRLAESSHVHVEESVANPDAHQDIGNGSIQDDTSTSISGFGIRGMLFGWLFGGEAQGSEQNEDVSTPFVVPQGSEADALELLEWLAEEPSVVIDEDIDVNNHSHTHAVLGSLETGPALPPYSDNESGNLSETQHHFSSAFLEAKVHDLLLLLEKSPSSVHVRCLSALLYLLSCTKSLVNHESENSVFDDGHAFVAFMEADHYKCAAIPRTWTPAATSVSWRHVSELLRGCLLRSLGSASCIITACDILLQDICLTANAPTRRYRGAVSILLDVFLAVWKDDSGNLLGVRDFLVHSFWKLAMHSSVAAVIFRFILSNCLTSLLSNDVWLQNCAQLVETRVVDDEDETTVVLFQNRLADAERALNTPIVDDYNSLNLLHLLLATVLDVFPAVWVDDAARLYTADDFKDAPDTVNDDLHALELVYVTTARGIIASLQAALETEDIVGRYSETFKTFAPFVMRCSCAIHCLLHPTTTLAMEDVTCMSLQLIQQLVQASYATAKSVWQEGLQYLQHAIFNSNGNNNTHLTLFTVESYFHSVFTSGTDALGRAEYWNEAAIVTIPMLQTPTEPKVQKHIFVRAIQMVLHMLGDGCSLTSPEVVAFVEALERLFVAIKAGPDAEECAEAVRNMRNVLLLQQDSTIEQDTTSIAQTFDEKFPAFVAVAGNSPTNTTAPVDEAAGSSHTAPQQAEETHTTISS